MLNKLVTIRIARTLVKFRFPAFFWELWFSSCGWSLRICFCGVGFLSDSYDHTNLRNTILGELTKLLSIVSLLYEMALTYFPIPSSYSGLQTNKNICYFHILQTALHPYVHLLNTCFSWDNLLSSFDKYQPIPTLSTLCDITFTWLYVKFLSLGLRIIRGQDWCPNLN